MNKMMDCEFELLSFFNFIFIYPNYFLVLHVPLWNRHNERRLLRFCVDRFDLQGNLRVSERGASDSLLVA